MLGSADRATTTGRRTLRGGRGAVRPPRRASAPRLGRARTAGRVRAVALAALLAAGVAAAPSCSGDDADAAGSSTSTTTSAPASTTTPAPEQARPGSGGVTVTPDPVPVGASDTSAKVTVAWQGQAPRTLIFVRVCRKPVSDPTFKDGIDCSLLSELTPNGTPDGDGSIELTLFRGENPDGGSGWGCFAPGDRAPAGVQANTTCYVRVTNDVDGNAEDARDAAFTFQAR